MFEYLRVIHYFIEFYNKSIKDYLLSFCFRLPDGFTQLRALAHLSLNDVSLQTLPSDIGKYVYISGIWQNISEKT